MILHWLSEEIGVPRWLVLWIGFVLMFIGARMVFALTPTPTPVCPAGATPGPTACPADNCGGCYGDADRNGFINSTDFAAVADQANFGANAQPPLGLGDADLNGFVNFQDYGAVQSRFGRPCP